MCLLFVYVFVLFVSISMSVGELNQGRILGPVMVVWIVGDSDCSAVGGGPGMGSKIAEGLWPCRSA